MHLYNRGISAVSLLVLLAVIILVVVGYRMYGGTIAPTQDLSCADCNVIIIGIDTLGARHVHGFGYEKETTPNLDEFIQKSYSFTNAFSASSWTVPSFMSVMTSLYPSVHGVVNKYVVFNDKEQVISDLRKLSPDSVTLAQTLKEAGYATGGFTGDAGVSGAFGYNIGFDVYTDEKPFGGLGNSRTHADEWLDSLPEGQKFFMFFHGYDLHGQYPLPPEDQRHFVPKDYAGPYTGDPKEEAKLREDQLEAPLRLSEADAGFWNGMYDSKIREADAQFGAFVQELERRGLLEKTIIVVVSDHGEEYFEHGGIDHGHTLYDELINVPLIVYVPHAAGGKKISAQASTMDIGPTILSILGIGSESRFTAQAQGVDLVPYMKGTERKGHDVYMETDYRTALFLRAIRTTDGFKYIYDLSKGTGQLYDLNRDPNEQKDISAASEAKANDLKERLFAHIRETLKKDPESRPQVGCLPVYPTECI